MTTFEQAVHAKQIAMDGVATLLPQGAISSVGIGMDAGEWVVKFGVAPDVEIQQIPPSYESVRVIVERQGRPIAARRNRA